MATMFTWRSDDPAGPGLESARVVFGDTGFRAVGRMVRTTDDGVFTASYRLEVGATGALARLSVDVASEARERNLTITRSDDGVFTASYRLEVGATGALARLSVDVASEARERNLTITRSDDGVWLTDTGSGAARLDAGDALDVDLAFSPVFNALPIRRLGLHREVSEHALPMVFVSLPDATVEVTEQVYRTVGVGAPSVVRFAAGEFVRDMTVDADGMVLDYPDIARRV